MVIVNFGGWILQVFVFRWHRRLISKSFALLVVGISNRYTRENEANICLRQPSCCFLALLPWLDFFLAGSGMLYFFACFAFGPLFALGCLFFLLVWLLVSCSWLLGASGCLVTLMLSGLLVAGWVCLAWFASGCLL